MTITEAITGDFLSASADAERLSNGRAFPVGIYWRKGRGAPVLVDAGCDQAEAQERLAHLAWMQAPGAVLYIRHRG